MDDKDIIRLIPKRKKSFWRLIFSRAFLILALLIVQIERESYGYDIELSNDLDIRFDTLFNVTRVGD